MLSDSRGSSSTACSGGASSPPAPIRDLREATRYPTQLIRLWAEETNRIAELGVDRVVFPSEGHGASWVGMCPGHNESAGKRKSGKARKGSQWLRTALTEAAWAASPTRTYLGPQYHRFARRRGQKKAVVAAAHSTLVIASHILKHGTTYLEFGQDSFDRRDTARNQARLVARLRALGLRVTLEPVSQAAQPGTGGPSQPVFSSQSIGNLL